MLNIIVSGGNRMILIGGIVFSKIKIVPYTLSGLYDVVMYKGSQEQVLYAELPLGVALEKYAIMKPIIESKEEIHI